MRLEDFLLQNTPQKNFPKGVIIFSGGSQASAAYHIAEGQIEIFKTADGHETTVAILGPGQIFGEMALLRYDEHTLSARAAVDSILHVITPDILHTELRAAPPLIRAIVDMLIERVYHTNQALIDLDRATRK